MRRLDPRNCLGHRQGFTLIEVLVSVGIIVLLTALAIPAVLLMKKRGFEIRVKTDLSLISTALEGYKNDFGDYPRFADAGVDQNTTSTLANGTWLDYQNCRGAVLLCRALIGPNSADTSTDAGNNFPPNPGDDGADGPGFRTKKIPIAGPNGTVSFGGKVYGAYLDSSKFKVLYISNGKTGQPLLPNFPTAFPVIIDLNGVPILYYPAAPGNPPVNLGYNDPQQSTSLTTSSSFTLTRFNGFDNQAFLDSSGGNTSFSATSPFAQLAANCGTPNYLLWTAGADNQFGLLKGKSDDIANFDLPGNLKK